MTPTRLGIPLPARDASWVVEQACLAPSIHNTQPWRFTWDGICFELLADTQRGLTATDPDGRELVISCGAALFNMRLALRKLGYDAEVQPLPDRANPRLLARVAATEGQPADVDERRAFAAMTARHTNRGEFEVQAIGPDIAVALQRLAELEHAQLVLVADPGQRRRILALARAAERSLASDADVHSEIAEWTPPPGSGRKDGVPVSSYAAEPQADSDDLVARDYDQGRGQGIVRNVMNAPGAIAVLVTDADLEHDWLRAGQALERVLVGAVQRGGYAALHSQLAEVGHLRSELRRELCVSGYPQILLRLGYAAGVARTPRRPVSDVLVTSPING